MGIPTAIGIEVQLDPRGGRPPPEQRRDARSRRLRLYGWACPTVSAIFARRAPIGWAAPSVVSRAVWFSISALSLPPIRITAIESQIQVMKPITAPSEP